MNLDSGYRSILQTQLLPYNKSTHAYVFDLTQYIQDLISGREANNGFFMLPRNSSSIPNRVVLGGVGNPAS